MMAKKPNRAISEQPKGTPIPTQNIKRKKITTHLEVRKRTRSLKNLAITKLFPAERAEETLRESEETAKRLAQENATMAEIGRIVSSTLNIEEVYEGFAEEVRKLIPFDRIVINTIDVENATVINVYMAGKGIADRKVGKIYPLEGSGNAEMVRTKSSLLVQAEDFREFKDHFPMLLSTFEAGFQSIMNVPLFSKGRIIGGLLLRSVKPYAYTDKDVRLAERVSNQIAGAIANAQLFVERKRTEEALRENEKRLQALMDASPIGISWADMEGNIKYNNRKFRQLFGYTVDDIPTITQWRRLAYPDPAYRETVPSLVAMLTEAQKQGKEIRPIEVIITCKDGSTRYVEQMGAFASNRILAIFNDLTEHKLAEESLRESEEKYRTILENIEEAYFEDDLTGNFTFVNDVLCRLLGYTRQELIGMNSRQFTDEENATKLGELYTELYKTGKPIKAFDLEAIRKDGTKVIYETSVSLMKDSEGKPIGFRGVSRDVTERKLAEKALRKSEEKYRTILEEMEEGYFETDLVGNLTFINNAGCRNLRYSIEELIGKNNRVYADEKNAKKVFQAFNKLYRTGEPCRVFDYEVTRKDGTKEITELSASLMRDSEGKPIGFRGISHYVTERKKMEGALREREEQYRTLLETMEEGYYEVDLAGNLTSVNDSFCKMHGFSKEKMLGLNNREYMSEETARGVYKIFNGVYKTGQPSRLVEWEIMRGDGRKTIIEASVYLIKNAQGERIGFRGIERDITERKRTEELLRQSEEKYRNILESIQEGYFETDLAGNYTFVNDANCRYLGYTREELIRMNYRQHTEEKIIRRLYPHYRELYRTGKPIESLEFEALRKDGTKVIYETSLTLMRDSKGKPIGVRGVSRDITERKHAEEALHQSEERYRTILQTMQEAYYEIDLDGHFTFVNDALCKHLGYTKEELIGTRPRQYQDETTSEKMHRIFSELYRTGEPLKALETEYVRKNGTKGAYELSVSLIRDAHGKPVGFRGVSRDVTERRRAEEALRHSEERYRTILESIEDGYYEEDLAGNFDFFNEAMCRIYGYPKEELLGLNYKQYTDEETAKKLFQVFNEMYRTGNPCNEYSYELITKDGVKRYIEASASLRRDSSGKPTGFRGVVRDVTERKQAEEETLSLQEQLRQSQKMEAIGQLAGGVAHDFNNLLTVIKGYSQISLLDLKENDPLRGNIQEIEKATQRATDLTRQLLAFSRRQILDFKVLDLNALLKDLEKMLRRIIGEDIELVTLLSEDLGRVKIDPSQIEQVIFNLAANARDAMPSGGKLTIETANVELDGVYAHAHVGVIPGRYVSLSVSDTGVGMSQDVKEKVFEPFFTTKAKGKGTGLGLSMVYGIVKQSNGNIWLYSEPGHGTTFKIHLPRIEEALDALHGRDETDSFPRGSETILLVEDDELVRDLANRLLKQQGYRVWEAANGEEALAVAREHDGEKIHLLLADIVMPQMGGKELANQLKIVRPDAKVLYTSGYADEAIVHHGVLDPGTHFLQKPFSLKTLSNKVREVLDG